MAAVISIRQADVRDAKAVSHVLCASIRVLCGADHKGDGDIIARWTANKTPEHVAEWISDPRATIFLAERGGETVGVGSISDDGEIRLNYVDPAHRFSGVSRRMLAHLEGILRDRGVRKGRLSSTETAHRLYREAGWMDIGKPETAFGMRCYPMEKEL